MKQQIRKSVFETNSSSVHTIAIAAAPQKMEIPKCFEFYMGEYGWEVEKLSTPVERGSYLYTAMYSVDGCVIGDITTTGMDFIKNTLAENGCEAVFVKPQSGDWHYIDHGGGTSNFVGAVLESKETLLNYLFGDGSVVYTYNDNMDYDDLPFKNELDAKESSGDYITFRKGN